MLQEGYRMEKPNSGACSQKRKLTKLALIYYKLYCYSLYNAFLWFHHSKYRYESVMLQCWSSSPDERPTSQSW